MYLALSKFYKYINYLKIKENWNSISTKRLPKIYWGLM
jgi:hypothetical protein